MAHKYAEIVYESRGMVLTVAGIKQDFVLVFCIDPEIEPVANYSSNESGLNFFDYDIIPYDEDVVALEYAYTLFPDVRMLPDKNNDLFLLIITDLKLDNIGPYQWKATASYGYDSNTGTGGERANEDDVLPYIKIGFTIGGGTREITKPLSSGTAVLANAAIIPAVPALPNLIGVSKDGVKGTTVPNSTFRLQITTYYLPSVITLAFAVIIQELIKGTRGYGTYNDNTFLGTASGETQLLSASGGGTVVDIIPVTYEFDLAKNLNAVTDDGFPNLTALGHDLVDYGMMEEYDPVSKLDLITPQYRIVHKIAEAADYSLLKIPGAT